MRGIIFALFGFESTLMPQGIVGGFFMILFVFSVVLA